MTADVVSGGPPDRPGRLRSKALAAVIAVGAVILAVLVAHGFRSTRRPAGPLAETPWAGERLDTVLYADAHGWQFTRGPSVTGTVELTVGNQGHLPVAIYALAPTSPVLHLAELGVEQPLSANSTGTLPRPVVLQPGKFVQIEIAFTTPSCHVAELQPGALRLSAKRTGTPTSPVTVVPTGTSANSAWTTDGSC